jgi:hypothetical protein
MNLIYIIPATKVPLVAKTAATLIKTLVQLNLTEIKNIHVIGHSLGAHISGGIGMYMQDQEIGLGVRMPRITGKISSLSYHILFYINQPFQNQIQ